MPIPKLVGKRCTVRRNQQILEIPQRGLRGQGLSLEDVESGCANFARSKSALQCRLINQVSAADVQEASISAHLRKGYIVEERPGLSSKRSSEQNVFGFGQQFAEFVRTKNLVRAITPLLYVFPQSKYPHAERHR